MRSRVRLRASTAAIAALPLIPLSIPSQGCPVAAAKSREIPIEVAPGTTEELYVTVREETAEEGTKMQCYAYVAVSLSTFPSLRQASRPADFASILQETLEEWEQPTCSIYVRLENDAGYDLKLSEMCYVETFGFEDGRPRSIASERSCWVDAADSSQQTEAVADAQDTGGENEGSAGPGS